MKRFVGIVLGLFMAQLPLAGMSQTCSLPVCDQQALLGELMSASEGAQYNMLLGYQQEVALRTSEEDLENLADFGLEAERVLQERGAARWVSLTARSIAVASYKRMISLYAVESCSVVICRQDLYKKLLSFGTEQDRNEVLDRLYSFVDGDEYQSEEVYENLVEAGQELSEVLVEAGGENYLIQRARQIPQLARLRLAENSQIGCETGVCRPQLVLDVLALGSERQRNDILAPIVALSREVSSLRVARDLMKFGKAARGVLLEAGVQGYILTYTGNIIDSAALAAVKLGKVRSSFLTSLYKDVTTQISRLSLLDLVYEAAGASESVEDLLQWSAFSKRAEKYSFDEGDPQWHIVRARNLDSFIATRLFAVDSSFEGSYRLKYDCDLALCSKSYDLVLVNTHSPDGVVLGIFGGGIRYSFERLDFTDSGRSLSASARINGRDYRVKLEIDRNQGSLNVELVNLSAEKTFSGRAVRQENLLELTESFLPCSLKDVEGSHRLRIGKAGGKLVLTSPELGSLTGRFYSQLGSMIDFSAGNYQQEKGYVTLRARLQGSLLVMRLAAMEQDGSCLLKGSSISLLNGSHKEVSSIL